MMLSCGTMLKLAAPERIAANEIAFIRRSASDFVFVQWGLATETEVRLRLHTGGTEGMYATIETRLTTEDCHGFMAAKERLDRAIDYLQENTGD